MKLDTMVSFMVPRKAAKLWREQAKACGINLSAYLRLRLLDKQVIDDVSSEPHVLLHRLRKVS